MATTGNPETPPPVIWPKPPVVVLLFIAAGVLAEIYAPLNAEALSSHRETIIMGGMLIACAIGLIILSAWRFFQAQTTIVPGEVSNKLLTGGVFQRSRNPIYLGFVIIALGLSVALQSLWLMVATLLLGIYLQERVIKREEAYLLARFGDDYAAYKKRTRRWF